MAEAEAEAQAAWKARVRARVEDVDTRLGDVRGRLDGVPLHLEAPMGVADAAGVRSRILFAQGPLKVVSDQLADSETSMHAAEIFALQAAKIYALDLGAQEPALQSALTKLATAREHAVDASSAVQCCRGHLMAAFLLLDHPGLPDVNALINLERNLAGTALESARRETSVCAVQVGLAREDMVGAN